ncbi:MAG: DNA methyltransferase [Acidimicrobiia bacterium]
MVKAVRDMPHDAPGDAASDVGRRVPTNGRQRRPTSTSRFGVSRRENHDASEFYGRFPPLVISADDTVAEHAARDQVWVGDARDMDACGDVADGSVALVVTSPPYFAGKEYETAVGEGHVPESYRAYLRMLRDVFAECARKLEPGGRIAVNVANLGRKPYRSLSADVIDILQNLGLLLRGEVIWQKARGAGGNCAWGSFQRPGNPVLRDLTERVVIASKGRFDRAVPARARAARGLPSAATISADEFMDLTTDVWELAPERATRVGHPAPFPVELPRKLIDLYTYEGDLVLDPFMGSGSTAVAAVRTGRHFVGFDTDPDYVATALARVAEERESGAAARSTPPVRVPAVPAGPGAGLVDVDAAVRAGRRVGDVARLVVEAAGFTDIAGDVRVVPGVEVTFRALDRRGEPWYLDLHGAFSPGRPGLSRAEVLWRALGRASVIAAASRGARLVLLTTDVPTPGSAGGRALAAVRGSGPGATVADVVTLVDPGDLARLAGHAHGGDPGG